MFCGQFVELFLSVASRGGLPGGTVAGDCEALENKQCNLHTLIQLSGTRTDIWTAGRLTPTAVR